MAGEPHCKKPKFDASSFHANEEVVEKLRVALRELKSKEKGFCLLKVKNCNAELGVSFSHAFCHAQRNSECASSQSPQHNYSFPGIYQRGFEVLESYMENPANIPGEKGVRIALERLLEFFTDYADCERALQAKIKRMKETDRTVWLAHHLLSKLSLNQDYIIDNHAIGKDDQGPCICCNEKITGQFGDTSIGAAEGWHGYVDILLGVGPVPVQIAAHEQESPDGNETSFEISDELYKFRQQILAETIVFSFVTKKRHPEYNNFLVPTIAITGTQVVIYFYDCENDILLESSPLPIITEYVPVGETITFGTVLALWLTVNSKYFCLGTPASIRNAGFTADFLSYIKDFSSIYQENVKLGGVPERKSFSFFEPAKCLYMVRDDCV